MHPPGGLGFRGLGLRVWGLGFCRGALWGARNAQSAAKVQEGKIKAFSVIVDPTWGFMKLGVPYWGLYHKEILLVGFKVVYLEVHGRPYGGSPN